MWSLVGKNNSSKTLYLKYCQTKRERSIGFTETCQKSHWKIMLEREKDETHTFRQVDMCKWQMDDPETNEVFVIGLHMVGRFEYGIILQSNLEN